MLETHTVESLNLPSYSLQDPHSISGNWIQRHVPDIRKIRHSCEVLPKPHNPQSKYTIKYVGVTNGQIGILSTKRPIPRLPFRDVCMQQPLPLIYASESRRQLQIQDSSPIKLVKRELNYIQTQAKSHAQRKSPEGSRVPQGEDFVVNRYAFPRGLVAVRRKRSRKSGVLARRCELSLQLPSPRRGLSGWMLSSARLEDPLFQRIPRRKSQIHVPSTNSGSLYLKSLQLRSYEAL